MMLFFDFQVADVSRYFYATTLLMPLAAAATIYVYADMLPHTRVDAYACCCCASHADADA